MESIVIELQQEALKKNTPITDLLRKSLLVATKLKVSEFEIWIQNELNGYRDCAEAEIPSYRHLTGIPQVMNPYHGWQDIIFENNKTANIFSKRAYAQSISEIEYLIENYKHPGRFEMSYSAETIQILMKSMKIDLTPILHISEASISAIIDSVRNIILKWALKLEEDGIYGSGISFNEEEIKKAQKESYIVNNFYGEIRNSQIQQGTHNSTKNFDSKIDKSSLEIILKEIQSEISKATISQNYLNDIYAEIETIKAQIKSSKPKFNIVKESMNSIKDFLTAAGSGVTANIIFEIMKNHKIF